MRHRALSRVVFFLIIAVGAMAIQASLAKGETLIYFTRHGEDMVNVAACVTDPEDPEEECCQEILNPLGELRAQLLADWFDKRNITRRLTHILGTHKIRTRQTIQFIADQAGLDGGGDANPDDGIQQVPNIDPETGDFIDECTLGYFSSKSTREPMLNAILDIHETEASPVVLVAGHSPQLYWVMRALGLDTSDNVNFPKTCKKEGHGPPCDNIDKNERVSGFNNVWMVVIYDDGYAELLDHHVFEFGRLKATSTLENGEDDPDEEE